MTQKLTKHRPYRPRQPYSGHESPHSPKYLETHFSRKFGMTALNRDDFASFRGSDHNGLSRWTN
jgi:hypothetical protein